MIMRETRKCQKTGKSILSLLLVVCLLFSAVPFSSASAAAPTPADYANENTAVEDPIANEVYPGSGELGYVQLKKAATWGDDTSKTKGYIKLETYGTPIGGGAVDVILICDKSGSMGDGDKAGTNMHALREAAEDFVDIIMDENVVGGENENRISIVTFSNTATIVTGFQGINEKANILATVRALQNDGMATNYAAAFTQAEKVLQDEAIKGRTTYVLFMTDGEPNPASAHGTAEATKLKTNYPNATVVGIGLNISNTTYQQNVRNVSSLNPGYDISGTNDTHYVYFGSSSNGSFNAIYQNLGNQMMLAGTEAVVTDYINTDWFEYDSTRPVILDGAELNNADLAANEITIDTAQQKITWDIGDILATTQTLEIPIKFTGPVESNGNYYTNKDLADTSKLDDRATITYKNAEEIPKDSRKRVESPALARPFAGVQVKYYEVNAQGKPIDNNGDVLTTDAEWNSYRITLPGGYGRTQEAGTRDTYEAVPTINDGKGNFYKLYENAERSTTLERGQTTNLNTVEVIPDDNDDQIIIYFGYVKVNAENMTVSKTYEPALPGHVNPSTFIFTDLDTNSTQTWNPGNNGTGTIKILPDVVYKVEETAATGYKAINTFYLLYDGNNLICVDENKNPAALPVNVTQNGWNLEIVNEQDTNQKREIFYTVEYYLEDQIVDSETETVKETVWTNIKHLTTQPVVKPFYGYVFSHSDPTVIPAEIEENTTIRMYYTIDQKETHEKKYFVEYYLDGVLSKTETVRKQVQVLATEIEADQITATFTGYTLSYTDPTELKTGSKLVGFDKTVKAYYIKDATATKNITYTVNYYLDGTLDDTVPVRKEVWINDNTTPVEPFKTYPGYALERTEPTPAPTNATNLQVINVYYKTNPNDTRDIKYTVKYLDVKTRNEVAPQENFTRTVWAGNPVATYQKTDAKTIPYMIVVGAEDGNTNAPLTFPAALQDETVLVVLYDEDASVPKTINYTIEYYQVGNDTTTPDDTEFKTATVVGTTFYVVTQNDVSIYRYTDQVVDTAKTALPALVSDGSVIKVYFKQDPAKVKDAQYTVRYYVGGRYDSAEVIKFTDIPSLQTTLPVRAITRTYTGYAYDYHTPDDIVDIGGTVDAYFEKDDTQTKPLTYTIRRMYMFIDGSGYGEYEPSDIETVNVWVGDTTYPTSQIPLIATYTDPGATVVKDGTTYKYNADLTVIPEVVTDGQVIDIYYTTDELKIPVTLNARVTYTGRMTAGMFKFDLYEYDNGSVGPRVGGGVNTAAGVINFDLDAIIPIEKVGDVMYYAITQDTSTGTAKQYDTKTVVLQMRVIKNSANVVTLEQVEQSSVITFSNK